MSNKLLEGSVTKSLVKLSLPIVMANFLHTGYQLTDTFWIGRLGTDAVAALSLAFPIIFLLISLGGGFTVSGTILVSQFAGQDNRSMVSKVCAQTFLITIFLSFILGGVGYLLIPYIIKAMTTSSSVQVLAISYLRITFIGLCFTFFYMMFQSLYRGVGDVKTPFYIVALTVGLNFIIDPLFIMGYGPIPAFGVDGAAYATVLTQGIAAMVGLYLLMKGSGGIKLSFKDMSLDFSMIREIIRLGIPASLEQSTRALAMTVMTFLISAFGKVPLAAYGIGIRVLTFVIIPSLGFSMATSTLVGQNIGANQADRSKEITAVALKIIFFFLSIAGILFYLFAEQTLLIFVPNSPEVVEEGIVFIRMISLTFGLIGIQQVASGAMRGGGSPLIPMLIAMITLWVVRFPIAYILSHHTDLNEVGVYWGFVISNILAAVLSLIFIRKGSWINDLTLGYNDTMATKVIEESITEEGHR